MIGSLFLIRAVVYIISCILIPCFQIPPKLQHFLGIFLQCISLTLKGSSKIFNVPPKLEIIIVGLILQGIK